MRVVPVLDIKNGRAVHAVQGKRAHYGPLRSVLHGSDDPIGIASALLQSGLNELYLADLDAIAGHPPCPALLRALSHLGSRPWVDAGLRFAADARALVQAGVDTIVAGLETLKGPDELARLIHDGPASRVVFSLDLFEGRPLVDTSRSWETNDARSLGERAIALGVKRLLLLDVALVGTGRGPRVGDLLRDLRAFAEGPLELAVGGGVSGPDDLRRLRDEGADVVLVGSALHDGRITPDQLAGI